MKSLVRVALVLAALAAGCSSRGQGNAPADCKAVGDRMVALASANEDALPERQRKLAQTQLQLVRDRVVKACETGAWPEPARTCMLAAVDTAAFDACAATLMPASAVSAP